MCSRDNDGLWSFAEVDPPDGVMVSAYMGINSSGSIAFLGNFPSANNGRSSLHQVQASPPSSARQVGIASPVDISLTFGYPNPVSHTRADVDDLLATLPGKQSVDSTDDDGNPDPKGDVETYHYKIEGGKGKKFWTIQTSANQHSFLKALESVPYVFYGGHSNCGAGVALKASSADPDLTTSSIKTVDDFLHLRNAQAAIPWKDFQQSRSEYQWFAQNAIAANQVAPHPVNYRVDMTGFSAPLLNGDGIKDNERFPNFAQSTPPYPTPRVPPGASFTLQSTSFPDDPAIPIPKIAMNCMHYWGRDQDGDVAPFVIVNLDNSVQPKFGYKVLFFDACNGARDYSEVFTHGCFISTTDLSRYDEKIVKAFVKTVMSGGSDGTQILREIKKSTNYDDFTEKDY